MRQGGPVSQFLRKHFTHYNAGELIRAADAYKAQLAKGNGMMVTLAGAMSTGELGKSLAEMIRRGYVHAISSTGANVEEDIFNLIGHDEYKMLPKYRDMTPHDDAVLEKQGMPRVTDAAISEELAMGPVTKAVLKLWQAADAARKPQFHHQFLYQLLNDGTLKSKYQIDPKDSWMIEAAKRNLPMVVPGAADSTLGNGFAAACLRGEIHDATTIRSDFEAMVWLAGFYADFTKRGRQMGFFQIGGGIAGDYPICVVPMLKLDLKRDQTPYWSYFFQVTDATTSYGGYSGALPREKL